jgi:hypothetical protein
VRAKSPRSGGRLGSQIALSPFQEPPETTGVGATTGAGAGVTTGAGAEACVVVVCVPTGAVVVAAASVVVVLWTVVAGGVVASVCGTCVGGCSGLADVALWWLLR